jgi:acyl-CoA synthetase (AMP-forming)/AMP-acid ligase II
LPPPCYHILPDLLEFRARHSPQQPAFFFEENAWSWSWLLEQSLAVAALLARQGVKKGDRVVLAFPNGPAFFPAFFGCLLRGAVAVPIYPGAGPERRQQYLDLSGSGLLLTPESVSEEALAPYRAGSVPELPTIAPTDPAFIQYTSGSTSDPKGVVLTHKQLLTNVRQMIAGMAISEKDVFVSWLPVYHDMGLILMTLAPFYLGLKLVLLPATLQPVHPWLRAIQDHRGSFTAAPDIAYRLALQWARAGHAYDLSSLRVALNAAEPVRLSTIQVFEETFGLKQVMTAGYGLAEATVGVCMSAPGTAPPTDAEGHVSVGKPFPGIELGILRDNLLAPPGEPGEILVKSPANTSGYFQNPSANQALRWENDYIRTGDAGYLDTEGKLYVLGRIKQVLKIGGRTLYAADVEEALEKMAALRHAMAIGLEGKGAGSEQFYVFAETRWRQLPDPEAAQTLSLEIVQTIHAHFGLRPARVYLLKNKSIPFTSNGKKQHNLLKTRFLDGTLRSEKQLLFPDY